MAKIRNKNVVGLRDMKYLVGIILPSNINHKIELIQQKYKNDRWNIALPPHITLMPPAKAILSSDKAIKIIEKTVSDVKKFKIEILDVNYFCNYYRTIYAAVENSSKLKALYKNIISQANKIGAIKGPYKSFNFAPHITLLNDLTDDEFNQRYSQVRKLTFNSKFICDKVLLFAKKDDQRKYRVVGEVILGE